MDNAYSHGFDYDAYRSSHRTFQTDEYPFELVVDSGQDTAGTPVHSRLQRSLVILVVLGAVLALGWYSLRFIPLFDIERVSFSVTGGFDSVPLKAGALANDVVGTSLMSGSPSALEHALAALPLVQEVRVRRSLFSTLDVHLHIASPSVFIAIVASDDTVESIHMVDGTNLHAIDFQDFQLFGNNTFVIEVSPQYGKHLLKYGIDQAMANVVSLAADMGMDEDGRYRIVGRIRYEESTGKAFGSMVMDLPAYNSKLYIREPVSESRLHDAVRLIRLEHELDTTRNIALIGQLRYDLYAQSLVSRQ